MGAIFAMVALLLVLFTFTVIYEGAVRFLDWWRDEAEFRKSLKGGWMV